MFSQPKLNKDVKILVQLKVLGAVFEPYKEINVQPKYEEFACMYMSLVFEFFQVTKITKVYLFYHCFY